MTFRIGNILASIPDKLDAEQFVELLAAPGLRIERIVSIGHTTPPGQWLAQDRSEWVLLVQGEASLRLEGAPDAHRLRSGDYLHIPAGLRHRVDWTAADPPTLWLAIHYDETRAIV